MRITDVETIVLRLPDVGEVCDGTQDAFVIRIHTDEGITGIGEADSMPTVLQASFDAPLSNSIGRGLRELLIGEDPLQIEPLVAADDGRHPLPGHERGPADGHQRRRNGAMGHRGQSTAGRFMSCSAGRSIAACAPTRSVLFPEDPTNLGQVRENASGCAKPALRR